MPQHVLRRLLRGVGLAVGLTLAVPAAIASAGPTIRDIYADKDSVVVFFDSAVVARGGLP